MAFDPLIKVQNARKAGLIPQQVYNTMIKRLHIVEKGIKRIEMASGLKYPPYYIEPSLVIAMSTSAADFEFAQFGILFARTIPVIKKSDELDVIIQITAPLIVYGLLGTIHAILAHEFMHYLELLSRIMKMNVISDEITGSLFENKYLDSSRLLEAEFVFKTDRRLIEHVMKKFPEGFKDTKLEEKVIKYWMDKHLPTTKVPLDSNIIKIPIEAMANLNVDRVVREKIFEFESRSRCNKFKK
jgi:hypothetical protein